MTRLQRIVLQPGDLPTGWTATPASPTSSQQGNAALAACVGVKDTSPDEAAKVSSSTFSNATFHIESDASSYRSEQDVQTDVALVNNPKLQTCAEQQFKNELASSLPTGATISALQVKVLPGANGGPSNVAGLITVVAQLTGPSGTAAAYVDDALITGPQTEASVTFTGVNARVAAATETALITAVAKRAAAG